MKAIIFSLLFFVLALFAKGQNQVNYWMGGVNAMVKFDNTGANYEYRPENTLFWRTTASISDSIGNLLFYTNGRIVFNRDFQTMLNGDNLNIGYYGDLGSTFLPIVDGALIIPIPENKTQYYLFHVDLNLLTQPDDTNDLYPTHIYYSIIDMSLDNGKGAIVNGKKDISILNDTLTQTGMKAIKHGNGRDWWILCHQYGTNKYFRFLIDPYGIHGPYTENIGMIYKVYNAQDGPAKFSNDGKLFVKLSTDSNIFELFDVDRCSGLLNNYRRIKTETDTFQNDGICFSPSSRYIYISHKFSEIFQFDLQATDISNSRITVGTDDGVSDPFPANYYHEEFGPDGRIYIASYDGNYEINVINNPEIAGIGCDFVQRGFPIDSPSEWGGGLPNIPNYSLISLSGSDCDTLDSVNYPSSDFTWGAYPNPFADRLNVSISGANTDAEISVFNLLGQKAYYLNQKQNNNFVNSRINLASLSAGMYIVIVQVNGRQYERKVVKR